MMSCIYVNNTQKSWANVKYLIGEIVSESTARTMISSEKRVIWITAIDFVGASALDLLICS